MGIGRSCRWIGDQLAERAAHLVRAVGVGVVSATYGSLQMLRGTDDFPQKENVKENLALMGSITDFVISGTEIIDSFIFVARFGAHLNSKEMQRIAASMLFCIGSIAYAAFHLKSPNQIGVAAILAVGAAEISATIKYNLWKRSVFPRVNRPEAQPFLPEGVRSSQVTSSSINVPISPAPTSPRA